MARVTKIVEALERRHEDAMHLLGEIVTTLTIPQNAAALVKEEAGKAIVELADGWRKRFKRLEGEA